MIYDTVMISLFCIVIAHQAVRVAELLEERRGVGTALAAFNCLVLVYILHRVCLEH